MWFNHVKFKFSGLIILLALLVSGCWDVIDIDRRAIVIALGLDAAPDNKVIASAQIPLVETSPISLGAQMPEKPFHTITSQANNAFNATLGLEAKAVKSLFWGQLKVVVINTALAERGLKKYSEFLERHPEIPPIGNMALTEALSQDILTVGLGSKFLPGVAIDEFFASKVKSNKVYPIRIWQFIKGIEVGPTDTYLPIVAYDEEEKVYSISGIGVFHRDHLVGKLSQDATMMAGIMMGKPLHASLTVPIGKLGEITYRRVDFNRGITVLRTQPNIEFLIKVNAKGYGTSITTDQTELSSKDIEMIENHTTSFIKKHMMDTIRRLQRLGSDIIGFGDTIRANRPKAWKRLDWEAEYPRANIQVSVKFTLERVGKFR